MLTLIGLTDQSKRIWHIAIYPSVSLFEESGLLYRYALFIPDGSEEHTPYIFEGHGVLEELLDSWR